MNRKINEKTKVLVIGLDGGTFDLIKPWIKEGKLPNLENMIERGTHGVLTSTLMPLSPTAWTSGFTGKNPGKHGVFDFFERNPDSYELIAATSKSRDGKMVWELLGDAGKKVGVVNVPLTYPPDKVNGVMISGLNTPGLDSNFTYPEGLYSELIEKIGDYKIYVEDDAYEKSDKKILVGEWHKITQKRAEAMFYLLKEYGFDFFIVVFMGSDWVQHFFWEYMDKEHPAHDKESAKKYGDEILRYYQKFDSIIGEVMESINQNTVLIVMSDHGFSPVYNQVFLNQWLNDLGILNFKNTPISVLKLWMFRQGITPHMIFNVLSKLKIGKFLNLFHEKTKRRVLNASFLSFSDIDWSKTKAYCPCIYGQLFINLKWREPDGIVGPGKEYEELIEYLTEELYKLKDPEDGKKIVDKVLKGKDIYYGKHTDKAPDLLCIMRNWTYQGSRTMGIENSLTGNIIPAVSGGHNMDGIFIIMGENIKKDAILKNANIIDIAPTILYTMGEPIPKDMDGKVLSNVFEESFFRDNPIQYKEDIGEKVKIGEKIRDLKTLGKI